MVYLSMTSLLLALPMMVFLQKEDPPWEEVVLVLLVGINLLLSILFWMHPVEASLLHRTDAVFARISFLVFSIYILFIKELDVMKKAFFVALLVVAAVLFHCSHVHSKKGWCSEHHLLYHSAFHSVVSVGCSMAFL